MAPDRAVGVAELVVEADRAERERFGTWLERSGFEVLMCPGPTEPDYTCVGPVRVSARWSRRSTPWCWT